MKRTLLFCISALLAFACCSRTPMLQQRAVKQLPVTLDRDLKSWTGGYSDLMMEEPEIIYADDSICVMQFNASYTDNKGTAWETDYRYIYLLDTFVYRMTGEVVYNESLIPRPQIGKEKIKEVRRKIRHDKKSMYDSVVLNTIPVAVPFDKE